MKTDSYSVELLDVAKEIGANVVITYHTAEVTLTVEQLEFLRGQGFHTDIMSCIVAGFMMSGKTYEDAMAFLAEADKAKKGPSVAFESPDGGALNIKSKKDNPMMDKLVQAVENPETEE